ncbi:MAG: AI-2E family transporter [Woeseiaceae bacterium]|nr:AI-2E family transporter [Woeseiaceae bacterium]
MTQPAVHKTNAVVVAAAVVVIIYGMQFGKALLIPFLLAAFIALITVRPMLWMQKKGVPAVLAALLIVVLVMLILAVVGTVVGRSIAEFTAALPSYQARLDTLVSEVLAFMAEHLNGDDSIQDLGDLINPGRVMGFVTVFLNAIRGVLTSVFLIFFTVVFILLEASQLKVKIEAAFGNRSRMLDGPRAFLINLGRYLGIKTLVSIATGFLAWLLTWSIGVDFPLLWGMLAFLLNYVPTIGSIIAAVPAILLALIQLGPGEALGVLVGFVTINLTFGNLIEPRLMGYGVGISPLVVFVGLIFWYWVFGPVGMLLSVPLTMVVKLMLETDEETRWIAILLGSERDAKHTLDDG